MKESLYTIGELSKLSNVSIKALRYYDKINLFKPAYVDPNTSYRYYQDSQLYHLDLIKSLKYIGTSLHDVKNTKGLKAEELFAFLTEQEKLVRKKLDLLLETEQKIAKVKSRLQKQMEYPSLNHVFVANEKEIRIIQTESKEINPKNVLNASFSKLKNFVGSTDGFMDTSYGAIFSFQPYTNIDEITYSHIYTPILTDKQISTITSEMKITTIPQGKYVCIAHLYSPEHYINNLQKLIDYIASNQLTVMSDVYELFAPVHYSPNQQEEYIVEMKIRVSE